MGTTSIPFLCFLRVGQYRRQSGTKNVGTGNLTLLIMCSSHSLIATSGYQIRSRRARLKTTFPKGGLHLQESATTLRY
jgi:hypothetical protein